MWWIKVIRMRKTNYEKNDKEERMKNKREKE